MKSRHYLEKFKLEEALNSPVLIMLRDLSVILLIVIVFLWEFVYLLVILWSMTYVDILQVNYLQHFKIGPDIRVFLKKKLRVPVLVLLVGT